MNNTQFSKGPLLVQEDVSATPSEADWLLESTVTLRPSSFPALLQKTSTLPVKLTSSLKTLKLTGKVFISTNLGNKISKSG